MKKAIARPITQQQITHRILAMFYKGMQHVSVVPVCKARRQT
jgi:hypothetical protein